MRTIILDRETTSCTRIEMRILLVSTAMAVKITIKTTINTTIINNRIKTFGPRSSSKIINKRQIIILTLILVDSTRIKLKIARIKTIIQARAKETINQGMEHRWVEGLITMGNQGIKLKARMCTKKELKL